MYNCYVHGWSSHQSMCPACVTYSSSGSTTDAIIGVTQSDYDKLRSELKAAQDEIEGLKLSLHSSTQSAISYMEQVNQFDLIYKDKASAFEDLESEANDLRDQLIEVEKYKDHWYTEFCKLETDRASCCSEMERKLGIAIEALRAIEKQEFGAEDVTSYAIASEALEKLK